MPGKCGLMDGGKCFEKCCEIWYESGKCCSFYMIADVLNAIAENEPDITNVSDAITMTIRKMKGE